MSDHPNVETVNRDDQGDLRPGPRHPGQDLHRRPRVPPPWPAPDGGRPPGLGGFLGVLGSFFEVTGGQIELDQQFCVGADGWAAEWEHATLGPQRDDKTLESRNAFVYRFEGDRIAEMWMFLGVLPEAAEASSPDRSLVRARLGGVVRAIEEARAACDSHRWGDAWRLLSGVDVDALDVDDLDRLATAAYLTGHDEEGFTHWVGPPAVRQRGRGAPGGALRDASSPRGSASRATSAAAAAGSTAPPASWRRPASTASSRATSSTAWHAADLRGRRHRRGARPLRPGRQDRRPLRPPRAGHPRPHRRGPHARSTWARSPRGWRCSTRRWCRSRPASCRRWRPATPTAR